ncbi:MFS transporter [Desulfovibrio sp. PG-178-WT-4]|uniref:MFS transporter n=1 Tax=Desulfovibrio porci TaxID=2605782 RepID=A0A6L5XHV2_9BACT|nr:MFS transporter [Desulfovibrio porci]MDY3808971.1 MFS transporter [Desulfovibrio porci]MSS26678.1 MFS transporter [Desulfovibrio porci]
MTQVQQDTIHKEANLISRLDRMPMNKSVMLLVGLLSWCWVMEAFDIGMIGQVVLVLKNLWHMDAGTIGILGSCSTAGVVIGTACAGFLTDRFGRKKILLWGVFIFTFFTLVGSAIADLWWIVSMRFIAGLGAGAVFPLPYLMISEIAPARHRGILVCICNAVLTAAYVLPTLCGSWAIRNFPLETAWRVPFIVGGIPIITIWFFHKYLPESPRWLMKRGRHEEVRRLVERLEKSAGVEHDDNFVDPQVLRNLQRTETDRSVGRAANWRMLFQPPYLSRSLVSWSMFSAGLITWYVVMVYVPTILTTYGFELSNSVILAGAMTVLGGVGSVVMGPLADKYGRKLVWSLYVIITIISLFLLTSTESITALLCIGALVAFFGTGIMPICKVYVAEQYPTELRGVGTGFGEAVSRIVGGVLATYYLAFFLAMGGVKAVFIFMAVAFGIAIIALWLWGQETAGRSVEDTASTGEN